jgi:hypothetical protein
MGSRGRRARRGRPQGRRDRPPEVLDAARPHPAPEREAGRSGGIVRAGPSRWRSKDESCRAPTSRGRGSRTGSPRSAIEALDRTGEVGASLPGTWLLRAEAYEALGNVDAAWDALAAGAARFPDQPEMQRQQVFKAVRLGLYREARERGVAAPVPRPTPTPTTRSRSPRRSAREGEHDEAMALLDAAIFEEGGRAAICSCRPRARRSAPTCRAPRAGSSSAP